MRVHWEKKGESRGERAIHAGVPLGVKVSPFPASLPFGKEHPFHVGVGEARVGGKFDVPGAADDAEGATSPISYAGSVAVHNADFLAFNTLMQCVNRGNPTLYGASACVMDMKKGLSLVAAPEVFVLNAAM